MIIRRFFPNYLHAREVMGRVKNGMLIRYALPRSISIVVNNVAQCGVLMNSLCNVSTINHPLINRLVFGRRSEESTIIRRNPRLFYQCSSQLVSNFRTSLSMSSMIHQERCTFRVNVVVLFRFNGNALLRFFIRFGMELREDRGAILFPFCCHFIFMSQGVRDYRWLTVLP